jgi:hypothetical protein
VCVLLVLILTHACAGRGGRLLGRLGDAAKYINIFNAVLDELGLVEAGVRVWGEQGSVCILEDVGGGQRAAICSYPFVTPPPPCAPHLTLPG